MTTELLDWYRTHARDLPWRRTREPYAIWVSEVMCQQTQIAAVLPFYARWMDALPTLRSLADADASRVLALWQGLGYYRRARLLHEGARWVAEHGMPPSARALREVPGIGPYTAGAIASICFGEAAPLVDGNVRRVVARLLGSELEGSALHRQAWRWAEDALREDSPRHVPGDWNQALMELGAIVCTPRAPKCSECPVSAGCIAARTGRQGALPRPKPRPPRVELAWAIVITEHEGTLGVLRIAAGRWWEGLWEFPTYRNGHPPLRAEEIGVVHHAVTHHRITAQVYHLRSEGASPEMVWVKSDQLEGLPMPALQRKALALWRTPHALSL